MSQPKWGMQFALAVALVAAGGVAFWLEFKHKPMKEELEEGEKKAFNLKDRAVESLRIVDPAASFTFKCADDLAKLCKPGDSSKWNVAEPKAVKGDETSVNTLLSTLNNLQAKEAIDLREETPEKKGTLFAEYGLAKDSISKPDFRRFEIKTADGKTSTAYFGATHPIGGHFFVATAEDGKLNEDRVLLVPAYVQSNFEKNLTHWRNKKLFSFDAHQIESFELKGSKAQVKGTRADGQWMLNGTFTGDIENIDGLLSSLGHITAKDFASDDRKSAAANKALAGARAALTLSVQQEKGSGDKKPEPVSVTLYKKPTKVPGKKTAGEQVFATVSGLDPLYELGPGTVERLDKTLQDLRLARLVTSMERFTAKRLEIAGEPIGKSALVLENKDSKWAAAKDTGEYAVDESRVQRLLDELSAKKIREFLEGGAIPAGEDKGVRVTLGDERAAEKRKIVFWKKTDAVYARDLLSKRKEAFKLDPSMASTIPWTRDALKKGSAPQAAAPKAAPPGEESEMMDEMPEGFPEGEPSDLELGEGAPDS